MPSKTPGAQSTEPAVPRILAISLDLPETTQGIRLRSNDAIKDVEVHRNMRSHRLITCRAIQNCNR